MSDTNIKKVRGHTFEFQEKGDFYYKHTLPMRFKEYLVKAYNKVNG